MTLPPAVVREATRAASSLVAVAPGFPEWVEYHHAFMERWGPGAAVPVRQVLQVLGFPASYRGSARRVQSVFTARDRLLIELAQRSALNGRAEVVLDDDLIDPAARGRRPATDSAHRTALHPRRRRPPGPGPGHVHADRDQRLPARRGRCGPVPAPARLRRIGRVPAGVPEPTDRPGRRATWCNCPDPRWTPT